jgi:hypothetical protein
MSLATRVDAAEYGYLLITVVPKRHQDRESMAERLLAPRLCA